MTTCDLCGTVSRPGDMFCNNCGERLQILSTERISLPPKLRFTVLTRDGHTCRYCGRSAPEVVLHIDHIIPLAKGGTNEIDNLITACADCNLGKGTAIPELDHIDFEEVLENEYERLENTRWEEQNRLEDRQWEEEQDLSDRQDRDRDRLSARLDLDIQYNNGRRDLSHHIELEYQKLEWKHEDEIGQLERRHQKEKTDLAQKQVKLFESFLERRAVQRHPFLPSLLQNSIVEIKAWGGDKWAEEEVRRESEQTALELLESDDPETRAVAEQHLALLARQNGTAHPDCRETESVSAYADPLERDQKRSAMQSEDTDPLEREFARRTEVEDEIVKQFLPSSTSQAKTTAPLKKEFVWESPESEQQSIQHAKQDKKRFGFWRK